MAERYNVRNVAQKEVYDSYMGILRISPNLVYGVDEDDATEMLHTLVDFRKVYGEREEQKEVKVQLSDSDGNMLPVYFIPRAFETEVTLRESGNNYKSFENIVNICTYSNNSVFVSKKLDVRSTLSLKIKNEKEQNNISLVTIVTGGQKNTIQNLPQANAILQYPIENPNDDYFFNKDNNEYSINDNDYLFLFSTDDERPRHEQMESNLFNQKLDWYQKVIKAEIDRTGEDPLVMVGGKYVNTFNVHNEDVPVFYTRDYVLGHYEGHSVKGKEEIAAVKDQWIDSQSEAYDVSLSEDATMTRLSWIRIDKLIWDAIDEIVSGKVRHSGSGRYVDMGAQTNSGTQIVKELFGIGLDEEGGTELNGTITNGHNSYNETAPILGQGVQSGLIMYHAMPLHRYWFHRCRQIAYNMNRYEELSGEAWSKYEGIIDEVNVLKTNVDNNLITPSCRASITPHHSLVKDFLFCNGLTVKFENYPNISLTNTNLLENDYQGKEAELVDGKFPNRKADSNIDSWTKGTYGAIQKSISNGEFIKTPNLFAFNETYPRFIRGLSWETDEKYPYKQTFNEQSNTLDAYTSTLYDDYEKLKNRIHSSKYELNEDGMRLTDEAYRHVTNSKDIWENDGVNIKKPIKNVSLHHYNYDFASKHQNHYHNLFSSKIGGVSNKGYEGKKFEHLAAFYTYGCYGGVVLRVASNLGTYYFNGNEHGNSDFTFVSTHCLALNGNYVDSTTYTLPKDWNSYCLSPKKYDTFHDFTPVGNAGLLLWNGYIYNASNTPFEGTSKDIEDNPENIYYITHYPTDLRETNSDNFTTEPNSLEKIDSFKSKVDGITDPSVIFKIANNDRKNRFIRKQQAIKLNEAEGRIPISHIGQAKYRMIGGHMIERKRKGRLIHGDKYDTEPISVIKNNIGNYTLKGINTNLYDSITDDNNKWKWSCLTSLPFEFPEFLGVGDLNAISEESFRKSFNIDCKVSNPQKYYINHNVTDRWKKVQPDEKIQVIKYGGLKVKADTQSPAPSHFYLLPLIRL